MKRFYFFNRYAEDAGDSIQSDLKLLFFGYILIFIYVAMMLGKLTRLSINVRSMPTSAFFLQELGKCNLVRKGVGVLWASFTPELLHTLKNIQSDDSACMLSHNDN